MREINFGLIKSFLPKLTSYIPVTLAVLFFSMLFAVLFGLIFYIIRRKRIPVLSQLVRVFMSYVRGTPPITQLFIVYFGMPPLLKQVFGIDITHLPGIYFAILTYALNFGVAVSENLRSSVASVSRGQFEAAYAIGMTEFTTYRRIVFPQMVIVALPNFANLFIGALKNTSLVFSVGVIEIMSVCQMLGARTLHYMEAYITVAIIYYIMYLLLVRIFRLLESSVKKHIRT